MTTSNKILAMRIALLFVFASVVVANFNYNKYKQEIDNFCAGTNRKVCTKDTLEYGKQFFQSRLNELQKEINNRKRLISRAQQIYRIQKIREDRYLRILRERFLDRHL